MSDKRDKFRLFAERRTNAAIDAVTRIGKLSNKNAYEFDPEDVKKIVRALRAAVSEVEEKFSDPKTRSGRGFRL